MTWTCGKCGKVFLHEFEYLKHVPICGLGYVPNNKCLSCNGTGIDVYGRLCSRCGGSGKLP